MPLPSLARAAKALPIAVLLTWAAWERFRLPLTPCGDGDIRAYLGPALSQLTGFGFTHVYGQCFLYPAILWAILGITGDFRWITVFQYGSGLATGALLFACWRQLRSSVLHDLAGVALAGLYLFSTPTIHFERAIRPEAFFAFSATLNIYLNLRFIRDRFIDPRPRRAVALGAAAAFVSVAAWLLKPSFAIMLVLANLPILIGLLHTGQTRGQKLALALLPAVAATALLILPEARLRASDPWKDLYISQSLFSIHADIINDQLAADAVRPSPDVPYPAMFIAAAHAKLTETLAEDRASQSKYWPVLGFNPDYLVNPPDGFSHWLIEVLGQKRETEFCRFYYWRAVRLRPWQMAAKVARQLGAFYGVGRCPAYASMYRPVLSADYQQSEDSFSGLPELAPYAGGNAFKARTALLKSSPLQIGPFPKAEAAGRVLSAVYFAGLAISALLLFSRAMRPGAIVTLFLFSYNFGTVLALAIGHTLDVGRYSQYQLSYTLLAEFASLWLVVEWMRSRS